MTTPRKERLARNEAMFRTANERMQDWSERHEEEGGTELYFCECADDDCREKVALTRAQYESVRSDSQRFFVVTGHEVPDIERVIENHGDWSTIEKDPDVEHVVEALDERQSA